MAYYVSSHGYGHAVRTCDILRAFCGAHPGVPVEVNGSLPAAFFRNRLPDAQLTFRDRSFDVGMVQLDSVQVDVAATLEQVVDLYDRHEERIAQERAHLRELGARLVVCDIPAIPLEAASAERIPAVAIGNFAWNWIYSGFLERDIRWRQVIDQLETGYACADLLLRLPFAEPMSVFYPQVDVPLLARPGENRRDELGRLTGANPGLKWVLLSFTSLGWDPNALRRVGALRDTAFFTVKPFAWEGKNFFPVDREEMPFTDVLASVDAVITKPGFGILSECIVNRKPMIYVEREDFVEYPILEAAVQTYLAHWHLRAADLYRGELGEAIEGIWNAEWPKEMLGTGGDEMVADRLYRCWAEGRAVMQ